MREKVFISLFLKVSSRNLQVLLFFVKKSMKGEMNMGNQKTKLERDFQSKLIKKIKAMFEGCMVMKLDATYMQGIPDLLVLYKDKWATLECKRSAKAKFRPNQKFYVSLMNKMSFSRFIYPENEEEVLHELRKTFKR